MAHTSDDMPVALKYALIGLLLILGLPIVAGIIFAEPVISCIVLGCTAGGIFLFKFILKKYFSIHIRSWVSFSLWLFLTVLIGFIIYSLFSGELTFKEMLSWGKGHGKASMSVFVLPLLWLVMTGITFTKTPAGRPAKNALEAEQHEIDELYDKAFLQNDFEALCELVNNFYEGENQKFFQKSPIQAAKVFEGAKRLVQLVEEDHEKQPELEDYYWLGLMYETGFACPPDFVKAIEYYTKALATTTCWDGDPKAFQHLCKQVQERLAHLQKPN